MGGGLSSGEDGTDVGVRGQPSIRRTTMNRTVLDTGFGGSQNEVTEGFIMSESSFDLAFLSLTKVDEGNELVLSETTVLLAVEKVKGWERMWHDKSRDRSLHEIVEGKIAVVADVESMEHGMGVCGIDLVGWPWGALCVTHGEDENEDELCNAVGTMTRGGIGGG